jgi:hypothetical protein
VTRNLISEEIAERNRSTEGGYTFNALVPDDYEGKALIFVALRLGDHAHVEVSSGRTIPQPSHQRLSYGKSGNVILPWDHWLLLREILDADPRVRIAEVEKPTAGQLRHHGPG